MLTKVVQYWFASLEGVLATLSQLSEDSPECVTSADWIKLVGLPQNRTAEDVQTLFYPDQEGAVITNTVRHRRTGFLTALDDQAYHRAYNLVASSTDIFFLDVHTFLKLSKEEGRIMTRILSHVVHWLNSAPTKVGERDNNKPPLRQDFLPALKAHWGDEAEKRSLLLEYRVLEFVRACMVQFKSPLVEVYLQQFPAEAGDSYSERFADEPWNGVLQIVREVTGPCFPDKPIFSVTRRSRESGSERTAAVITKAICALLDRTPEISMNTALNNKDALNRLYSRLNQLVIDWATQQFTDASETSSDEDRASWSVSMSQQTEPPRARREVEANSNSHPAIRPRREDRVVSPDNAVHAPVDGTVQAEASPDEERQGDDISRRTEVANADRIHFDHWIGPGFSPLMGEELTGARKRHRQGKRTSHHKSDKAPGHSEECIEVRRAKRIETPKQVASWRSGPAARSSSVAQ